MYEVILTDVEPRADVRMVEAGNGLRLALKALAEAAFDGLDRDHAIQPRVASPIDRTHPAHADRRFNARPEDGSWGEFHA